ncbi:MAG: phosphate acyltransferase [Candidatus Saccharibacteria bacterium]|nr:phosphate acyltransferase [Candidatus Saccharibacteria bacterium]
MKIVIPELENKTIQSALKHFPDLETLTAENLDAAANLLASGKADTMLSGLDYSSRDVLIAYKNHVPLKSTFFSSCFVCKKDNQHFVLADGGVNKLPSADQLYCIVEDSAKTYEAYFENQPKIAMLSYSTKGSGGKNPDLEKIYFVIEKIRKNHPEWLIDGEMQLDAAVNEAVGKKKFAGSEVAGSANVLITPDLNSGNILYKSMEQFGSFTMAGPIIQGFTIPLADLSRGSSEEDVVLTIDVIKKLYERQ